MSVNLDDLLRPTVEPAVPRKLPWRVSSQFWVAFLGGVPAVTAIAFINSGRLGMTTGKRRWILVAGVVALLVSLGLAAWLATMDDGRRTARIVFRVVAVVLYLVLAQIQREDDARHQAFGSDQYASLWIPGIVATVVSAVVMVGVIAIVAWMLLA